MKKIQINFSWPAVLSDFALDTTQENFSRARLSVFYKGETADHRYFSDNFSDELVKSLPYTPIVSYYDADEDDFVGHATEQQILGIVDPTKTPTFEVKEDGNTWCVCDVVLYTERPDMIGELAKKVVGHNQSLELDPRSVKYVINYDEKKHFKNIEFTAGRFVGVSVLGKNQKPAFTGSEFFAVTTSIEDKLDLLKQYCEHSDNFPREDHSSQINYGGNEMNLQEFITLSWGEKTEKVSMAVQREYENDAYAYLVDMYDDAAIFRFFYYVGDSKLIKINYTINDDDEVQLSTPIEVHVTYEPIEESLTPVNMEQVSTEAQSLSTEQQQSAEDNTVQLDAEALSVINEPEEAAQANGFDTAITADADTSSDLLTSTQTVSDVVSF